MPNRTSWKHSFAIPNTYILNRPRNVIDVFKLLKHLLVTKH